MPLHDWSHVPSGLFHHFHQAWSLQIYEALNAGLLPPKCYALVGQRGFDPDPYVNRANRVVVRSIHEGLVAVVEIISPGNKVSQSALRAFVEEAAKLLARGIHLLVIDLHPPTPRDPQGIHKAIWDEFHEEPFELPPDKPLTLASYAAGAPIKAYVEPVGVGDPLPDMPVFLEFGAYVQLPLERTYELTWSRCPEPFKRAVLNPT